MSIQLMQQAKQSELLLSGELSIYDVAELKSALSAALAASETVEINLSGVDDLDSAILQVLVAAKLQADRDGRQLRLTDQGEASKNTLELTGLTSFFDGPIEQSAQPSSPLQH